MSRSAKRTTTRVAIDHMVKRIVAKFQPQQVILFGSQARGDATTDSDVDLLVVMYFEGTAFEKGLEISLALHDILVPKDIIVTRPEDFAWRKDIVGTIEKLRREELQNFGRRCRSSQSSVEGTSGREWPAHQTRDFEIQAVVC
jgi:uncharacterized protein